MRSNPLASGVKIPFDPNIMTLPVNSNGGSLPVLPPLLSVSHRTVLRSINPHTFWHRQGITKKDGQRKNHMVNCTKAYISVKSNTILSILNCKSASVIRKPSISLPVFTASTISIMTSYNLLNGIHTANSYDLLQAMARDEWGFDGAVISLKSVAAAFTASFLTQRG